jgi:hypothetical protein
MVPGCYTLAWNAIMVQSFKRLGVLKVKGFIAYFSLPICYFDVLDCLLASCCKSKF